MRQAGVLFILMLLLGVGWVGCKSEPEFEGKKVSVWVALLRNDDWSTRQRASDALARLGPQAIPYLKHLMRATDPTLRRSVVLTLGKMGSAAKELVPRLLRRMAVEQVAIVRAEILIALAAIDPKAPGVPEEFNKRLKDQAEGVREAAQQGLEILASPKPVPEEKVLESAQSQRAVNFLLRDAVNREMSEEGVAFGLVAEVARERRRVAIVWSARQEGQPLGNDLVALVFEQRGEDDWTLLSKQTGLSQGQGPAKLVELLGGADRQRVVRPCGVAKDKLAQYLEDKARSFKHALKTGRLDEAMKAYEELSQAFSFRMVAFTDTLPELLNTEQLVDPPWKFSPTADSDTCPVEIQLKGKKQTGRLRFGSCGGGHVIAELRRD